MSEITVDHNTSEICIKIPIDLLIFAQENNPNNPCKITDKDKMISYFEERFIHFGEDEAQGSDFECLLDKFFSDATEYGELWIDFIPHKYEEGGKP